MIRPWCCWQYAQESQCLVGLENNSAAITLYHVDDKNQLAGIIVGHYGAKAVYNWKHTDVKTHELAVLRWVEL